jgi:hypothetical protein
MTTPGPVQQEIITRIETELAETILDKRVPFPLLRDVPEAEFREYVFMLGHAVKDAAAQLAAEVDGLRDRVTALEQG